MQKIPLNLAKPGMKLGKPVLRDNNLVVVAQGTELSDSLLMRLENMGIERITVEGNPVDMGGAAGDTAASKRLERLDHLFRGHEGDKWMNQVKKFLTNYFRMKAAAEAADEAAGEKEE
ncbi:hypothetical protein, partial [Desulfohalovibrio reitneri]|uniref:hypothetical protein n=1 Tax=Desulfohalovibrio reitneri TaxID=1307759 RepID=UPI0004A74035